MTDKVRLGENVSRDLLAAQEVLKKAQAGSENLKPALQEAAALLKAVLGEITATLEKKD